MTSPKFKVGDSVSLKKDPTDGWLVVRVVDLTSSHAPPDAHWIRYHVARYDGRKVWAWEQEIEPTR